MSIENAHTPGTADKRCNMILQLASLATLPMTSLSHHMYIDDYVKCYNSRKLADDLSTPTARPSGAPSGRPPAVMVSAHDRTTFDHGQHFLCVCDYLGK